MRKELVILPDAYRKRTALVVLMITGVLGLLFWRNGVSGSNAAAAFVFLALINLGGLLSFETHISEEERKVARVWLLGGLFAIWKRVYPFESLRGVQQLFVPDNVYDLWLVGLVTASGRFLMVTYFSSRNLTAPDADAERFRAYLAGILRMPVLDVEGQDSK